MCQEKYFKWQLKLDGLTKRQSQNKKIFSFVFKIQKRKDRNSSGSSKRQKKKFQGVTMNKESAIKYLKLLHKLEKKYSQDLFSTDLKELAERLRFEFIKAYNNKN